MRIRQILEEFDEYAGLEDDDQFDESEIDVSITNADIAEYFHNLAGDVEADIDAYHCDSDHPHNCSFMWVGGKLAVSLG